MTPAEKNLHDIARSFSELAVRPVRVIQCAYCDGIGRRENGDHCYYCSGVGRIATDGGEV
jgi:hypothetical protein